MGVNLKHFPEYHLELVVFSGAVTVDEMLKIFVSIDQSAVWLSIFSKGVDLSGVDVARFPQMKRAITSGASEPDGGEPKLSALVNLSGPSELFVHFWSHYASAGVHPLRQRAVFSTVEAACRWLGLPPGAAETLAEAAEAGPEPGPAEAEENRRKFLKAASRVFRERGFEAMTVADVMAAAGLTRNALGGFLESKDDLIVHALLDAMGDVEPIQGDLADYAAAYLSPTHKADLAGGCAMAALASDMIRESPEARAAMTAGLTWHIERLSRNAPGDDAAARRRASIRAWSAMIGALILARVSDDEALSREVLDETLAWIADPAIAVARAARPASPAMQPHP